MNDDDKTIFTFRVMWDGWGSDNVAWVMERPDSTRYLRMTSHSRPYEASVSNLEEKMDEYRSALAESKKALELLRS